MTPSRQIAYLRNELRKARQERDLAQAYAEGLEARLSVAGITLKEERKIWRLCKARDWEVMEDYLTEVLSPSVWMTKAELRELMSD